MTPEDVVREANAGSIRPVYLVVGEERVLVDRVVAALRKAALQGGAPDFNEDVMTAGEADIERVMTALRMAPMMAPRRFVLLRSIERWDAAGTDKGKSASQTASTTLDKLTAYATTPLDSTCLVLTASKLDGRRKLTALARSKGFLVSCEPVSRSALPRFVEREAKRRGHELGAEVADLIAETAGPELAGVLDAIERLSLYVGGQACITENDVAACVTRIRLSSVWELVDAVGRRDAAGALRTLDDVYDPQDRGLRVVGVLAWSTRQLLRFLVELRAGHSPDESARAAGVAPFKAREMANQVRKLSERELERWLAILSETDLALKGSRRPARAVLETAILTMTIGLPR